MTMSPKPGAVGVANGGLLRTSMRALRKAFITVGLFSCILNLLMLTGPIFMLQVYDRVLSSRSVPTLVALAALAATLYAFWGLFEFLRHRVMSRAGYWLDQQLGEATFREWMAKSIGGEAEGPRPLVDIAALRQFLSSPGLMGIFDAPWIPIYLAFVFIVHVNLGLLTTAGALIVMILALINQRVTREPLARATGMESSETRFLEQAQRNAEAILPMGMMPSIAGHWKTMHGGGAALAQNAGERGEFFSATSKAVRMMLQSAILGLGAYYAIYQQISPGMIVAVSIISGRALAPIDQIIGHWRIIARARQAHQRVTKELAGVGTRPKAIDDVIADKYNLGDRASYRRRQTNIFEARRASRTGEVEKLHEKIGQFESQIEGLEGLIKAKKDQLRSITEELDVLRSLLAKGIATRTRVLNQERLQSDITGQIAEHTGELARVKNAIRETEVAIIQVDRSFRENVLSEFTETSTQVEDLTQQIGATQRQLDRVEIRAPVTGIIHELGVNTVGGTVPPNGTLMQVIATDGGLDIEVSVEPNAIDQVAIGQDAVLRFPAFNQRTTPELNGRVERISPSSVTDEKTGMSFYRVRIALSDSEAARLGDLQLMPGMPVEAFIRTAERTPLSYLLKPLTDNFNRAMRER